MCFSASASFGAGLVLSVIGVASIKKVQQPRQILFAAIPLFFAVQQISEGFLWLNLSDPDAVSIQQLLTCIFLFFAQFFWPLWVPVAVLMLEKNEKRRKFLKILVGVGILVAAYSLFGLFSYPVHAKIIGYHIHYKIDYPHQLYKYGGILYLFATIGPPFLTKIKRMWIFGAAVFISYIISAIFYEHFVVSVWCFFASIISITVFFIMLEIKNTSDV